MPNPLESPLDLKDKVSNFADQNASVDPRATLAQEAFGQAVTGDKAAIPGQISAGAEAGSAPAGADLQQTMQLAVKGISDLASGKGINGVLELMQASAQAPELVTSAGFLKSLQSALGQPATSDSGSGASQAAQSPSDSGSGSNQAAQSPSDSGSGSNPAAQRPSDSGSGSSPAAQMPSDSGSGSSPAAQMPSDSGSGNAMPGDQQAMAKQQQSQAGMESAMQGLKNLAQGNTAQGVVELMKAASSNPGIMQDTQFISMLQQVLGAASTKGPAA